MPGADDEIAPPVFGKIDWAAFAVAALVTLVGYLWTLAPDLTLEDSGELAVAAQYAGVPHSPGYPLWTLYAWAFTKLLPFSNTAWRVAVASAVAGAAACGLIALLVARASRLLFAGDPDFRGLDRRRQNALALASGAVAGTLLGFSGFVWSQAVIVEVYTFSLLSLSVLLACLFRWMCVPGQRRYLYYSWFLFGICLNNHQSLVVIALAIEVCVAARDARLGRDLFLGNVICYALGLFAEGQGWVHLFTDNGPLLACYHVIGIASLAAVLRLAWMTRGLGREFPTALGCAGVFAAGTAFYLWLPLLSMGNPPMNWAYPRTVAGFFHALTRGQYESVHPAHDAVRYAEQLWHLGQGAVAEFGLSCLLLGLLPLLLLRLRRLGTRERGWLLGGLAFYVVLGPGLLVLINPGTERAQQALVRVFFAASHVPVAIAIGLGLALALAWFLTGNGQIRRRAMLVAAAAVAWSLGAAILTWHSSKLSVERLGALCSLLLAAGWLAAWWRGPARWTRASLLIVVCLMPATSILSHWWENEQRGHLFGWWFGHDMFSPPFRDQDGRLGYARAARAQAQTQAQTQPGAEAMGVYPEMARDAVLFGGTDPGRFCPTYMIFSESFLEPGQRRDPEFDRRDVYIITQNALADGHYLEYIRGHYQRTAQRDPYFFSELLRSPAERQADTETNLLARLALPLDRALTELGAQVETGRRARAVYPARELRLPTNGDLARCTTSYVRDLQTRAQQGQLRPGEEMRESQGQVQLAGPAMVMGINALLAREIFEQNPSHEFYVEESFPLDWMYPHLTPFGVIMKLERQPPAELTAAVVERDRRFWRAYMDRLLGDWVSPDTNITELCTFAERVHLHRDLDGYAGDLKFVRDDQAQKAFSKLRGSIGGIYDWRLRHATGQLQQVSRQLTQAGLSAPQIQQLKAEQERLGAEQTRMLREAEFAYKQSYALCPFNPEAVQRLVNLLLTVGRVPEALALAETSQKLDPGNVFYTNVAAQLRSMSRPGAPGA